MILEGSTQWANRAELYVGLFKEAVRKDMLDEDYPLIFWDHCVERRGLITNMTAETCLIYEVRRLTLRYVVKRETSLTSVNLAGTNGFIFERPLASFYTYPSHVLGRCLGPAKNECNEMSQWVMKQNGKKCSAAYYAKAHARGSGT